MLGAVVDEDAAAVGGRPGAELVAADGVVRAREDHPLDPAEPGSLERVVDPDDVRGQHALPGGVDGGLAGEVHERVGALAGRGERLEVGDVERPGPRVVDRVAVDGDDLVRAVEGLEQDGSQMARRAGEDDAHGGEAYRSRFVD